MIHESDRLYRYAYYLTNDETSAKDLMQETMLTALEKRRLFREDTNLSGWLRTLMKNIFINDYHHHAIVRNYMCRIDDMAVEPPCPEVPDIAAMDIESVNIAISRLKGRKKIIFGLYVAQYSYVEIAEKLNIPMGSVKREIHDIRQILRKQLRELGD
ncbi:MAG: RNA polymerase sigma factor [Bacteroidales bacterium]